MQTVVLKRCGDAKHMWDLSMQEFDVGDTGLSFGDGSGFVEDHGVDFRRLFEGFDALDQHAMARANARPHHKRGRGRQTKGARAGDDKGGHQHEHALFRGGSGKVPPDGGHHGEPDDHRDKNTRNPIDQTLDWSLSACAASTKPITRSSKVAPAASVTRMVTVASTGLAPP